MDKIENIIEKKLDEIKSEINVEISTIEKQTLNLIDKARKSNIINFWIDAFKYGLATSICVVPIYII